MNQRPAPQERPNRVPWPPLLTVGLIAIAWVVGRVVPVPLPDGLAVPGWALIGAALAADVWAALTFRRHRANIRPDRAATTLIADGPFAHSRNPIYTANVALAAGLGLATGNAWQLAAAAILFVLLREMAVKREEAHMAARFGKAWTDYTTRVRRWL